MAGDWIKMRQDLHDDPAVVGIAALLDLEEDTVVGKLHRIWCWADRHTTDGSAPAITDKWVDRYVSMPGFASAMVQMGWLSFSASGIQFPHFDRHNGDSAKRRAENTIRKRLSRQNRDEGMTGVERTVIPRPFARHVMERDSYRCVYCGEQSSKEQEQTRKAVLGIDHLIPISRGGLQAVENLVCCCRECNNEKNDRTPEEWGMLPKFLSEGVTYLSQQISDTSVTREEKRREEKKEQKTGASTNVESTPKKPSRGTRLPEDWEPSAEQIAWARKERPDIDPLLEARTFRNHWVSKPGKDAVKLNWNATWQNWISRAYGSPKKGTGSTTYARLPGEL